VEEALAHEFTPLEEEFIAARNARQAIGTPDEVKARLEALLASTQVDELMVSSGAATLEGRIRSLEIVRELYPAA
jgi:alkanesulfonate monooxygenase SsuD/methylene tetrahydromethanopterin reductase-like flavin-dependent oxidoreductase (luciferase family)